MYIFLIYFYIYALEIYFYILLFLSVCITLLYGGMYKLIYIYIKKHIYMLLYLYIYIYLYRRRCAMAEPGCGCRWVPKCRCCSRGRPGFSAVTGFPAPGWSAGFRAGGRLNHRSWGS